MSAATEAEARIHEADADGEDGSGSAAPFDLLLSDAARSPLRRFLPGMSGGAVRRPPGPPPARVAGRAAGWPPSSPRSRSAAPSSSRTRRTGASPTRPGRRTRS